MLESTDASSWKVPLAPFCLIGEQEYGHSHADQLNRSLRATEREKLACVMASSTGKEAPGMF